ncbi:hypothetical protein D9758_007606 [Tetrapyrgos nigripes]|uniref:Acetyl-CoA synthetase-like protein n=1 Tax=Tetrapyrgos nigripes TaxID=182062 RepID=A0A8H5G7Y9_9AGAR|nr:hypothetical protein D9758_007606 [Tetrapyrgos nigripes]
MSQERFTSLTSRPPVVYTTQQAQNSPTFTVPPLDGSILNGELIDWHLEKSRDHKFSVLLGDGDEENTYSTFAELGEAVHTLGRYILDNIPDGPTDSDGKPKVIAIFATLDPLVYATTILAISRTGFQPFPISPRNSQPALVHLLKSTSCKYIFASGVTPEKDPSAMESLSQSVFDEMASSGTPMQTLHLCRVSELYPRFTSPGPIKSFVPNKNLQLLPPLSVLLSSAYEKAKEDKDWPWMIIHSSGSTKFPKPIYIGQRSGMQWLAWPWSGETDIADKVLGTLATPSFHAMGVAMHLGAPLTSGAVSAFWKPKDTPPAIPTPEKFLAGLAKCKAQFSVILPSFLQVWSNDPAAIEVLRGLEAVSYGAGPLSKSIGDKLVAEGVNLQNAYGLTETGNLFMFFPKEKPGYDWQYGRFAKHVKPRLVPEEKGKFVLQAEVCDSHIPAVLNVVEEDTASGVSVRAFDTQDIVEEHPVKKGYWRIVGRADDQIMMANGEKTNPGPLELVIQSNSLVKGAFMFGRSRTQAGVAVEPKTPIDLSDSSAIAQFRNAIWPSVERANRFAPQHSRIFKEYILITDPVNRPLPRTPKGDVQRKRAFEMYEEDIVRIYKEVEEAVRSDWAKPPERWDEEGVRVFVERIVDGTVGPAVEGRKVDPERDLFAQGCDSLQATYIRQAIITSLHQYAASPDSKLPSDFLSLIPNNFVYEHPTQRAIEAFLLALVQNEGDAGKGIATVQEKKIAAVKAMVEKYTRDLPAKSAPTAAATSDSEVVLITGTTGTLGTYLLGRLLQDPRAKTVYALNRGKNLAERQREAFQDKGVDVSLLQNGKLCLLEGDTTEPKLGLSDSNYEKLLNEVTTIIANAWTLNFSMTLSSFESHVKGIRNLIDLALSSRVSTLPQLLFSSSVATVAGWTSNELIPEKDLDPEHALANGYGESKWVAEQRACPDTRLNQVLVAAAKTSGLRVSVLRIGQLSGSRVNGSWNVTDWVPQIVQSGPALCMLPDFPKHLVVSWLPVDVAADAFLDVIFSPFTGYRYLNLVHVHPVFWHDLFTNIAQSLGNLPLPPYTQWYDALKDVSTKSHAAEKVTAVRMVDFFASGTIDFGVDANREAMGMGKMVTEMTKKLCPSVGRAGPLTGEDTEKWIGYWKKHGMFDM